MQFRRDSLPAVRAILPVLAATLLAGCVSSKEKIERAERSIGEASSVIRSEATAAKAEIVGALALELPDSARPPLLSASKRQDVIVDASTSIDDDRADVREGLDGVKNTGSLWRKLRRLLYGLIAVVLVVQFGPALLPGAFAWLLKWGIGLSKSWRDQAKLMRKARKAGERTPELEAAAAAFRADPRGAAAWEREKKAEAKLRAERARLKAEAGA